MATRKVSAREEELMTPANIQKVINLLEPTDEGVQPITKKLACEMLGMSYNTTRLATILQQFKDKQAKDKQRRAEKRGKPATADEIQYVVRGYIYGESIDALSKELYRSAEFVKRILEQYNVPIRNASSNYFAPELLPEGTVRERFKVGEVVYSARYDSLARIEAEVKEDPKHGWVYRCWLPSEKWQQYCYQPASELASLEHFKELGISL